MVSLSIFTEVLRAVSSALQIPVIIVLLALIAVTIVSLGSLIAEYFTERRRMKAKIPLLIDDFQGKEGQELVAAVNKSGLLKRQKKALVTLAQHGELPDVTREALARRLLFEEHTHYERITRVTDLIARLGPMFGLMGTLIPLGPGLIALGQGDTVTLSNSLLIAFDTTVAGLISAAVAYVISGIRKNWYDNYETAMEALMECILDPQHSKALRIQADDAYGLKEVDIK